MTTTQICNLALAKLGATPITNLTATEPNAEHCRTHYEVTRQQLLRMAPWSFAIRRLSVASLTAPIYGPWDYAYQVPDQCIQVLDVNDVDPWTSQEPPFAMEGNTILSNDDECKVRYIVDADDPNDYPPDFVEAFALLLAGRMAGSLTNDPNLGQALELRAKREVIPEAAGASYNESRGKRIDPVEDSDLVAVRRWGR